MANLESILRDLKQERDRLDKAIAALSSLDSSSPTRTGNNRVSAAARRRMSIAQKARRAREQGKAPSVRPKRKISAAARARIAAAQRARWAKAIGAKVIPISTKRKRHISAAGLARIRVAQKRRWAKVRAGKK